MATYAERLIAVTRLGKLVVTTISDNSIDDNGYVRGAINSCDATGETCGNNNQRQFNRRQWRQLSRQSTPCRDWDSYSPKIAVYQSRLSKIILERRMERIKLKQELSTCSTLVLLHIAKYPWLIASLPQRISCPCASYSSLSRWRQSFPSMMYFFTPSASAPILSTLVAVLSGLINSAKRLSKVPLGKLMV